MLEEKGTLEEIPAMRLLFHIFEQAATGILSIKRERIQRILYFSKGRLVWAISNAPKDDLEKVITAFNLVAPKNIERVKKMVETPDALGKTLIEKGLLSLEELIDVSREQIKRIVIGVLKWRQGDYQFVSEPPPERLLTLDLNVTDMTRDFILRNLDIGYIQENIGELQSVYKKNPDNQKIGKYNLSEVQEQILRAFDGTRPLDGILSQYSGANRESVLKIIYYFLMANIISIDRAGSIEVPVPMEDVKGNKVETAQPAYDPAVHNEMPDLDVDDIEYAFERQVDLGFKEEEAAPLQEEKPEEPGPAFQQQAPEAGTGPEPANQHEMPAEPAGAEPGYEPGMLPAAGGDGIAANLDGAFMEAEAGAGAQLDPGELLEAEEGGSAHLDPGELLEEGAEQAAPGFEQPAPAAGVGEQAQPQAGYEQGDMEAAAGGAAEAAGYDYQDVGIERGEAAAINLEQGAEAPEGAAANGGLQYDQAQAAPAGAGAGINLEFDQPLEVERGAAGGAGEAQGLDEPGDGDMAIERGEVGSDYDYEHIEVGGEAPKAAGYDGDMEIERGETASGYEQEEMAPPGQAPELADDYGTDDVGAEEAGAAAAVSEQEMPEAETAAAPAAKKKSGGKLKQLADGTYTFVQEGEEEEEMAVGVTEKLPDNEAYNAGGDIEPPGEFAAAAAQPPAEFSAGGEMQTPDGVSAGGEIPPPDGFSAGGEMPPPGEFAAADAIQPPGEFAAAGEMPAGGDFTMSGGPPSAGPVLADDEDLLPPKKYPAVKVPDDRKPSKSRRKPSKSRRKPVKRKAAADKKGSRLVYLVFIAIAAILVISGAIFLYLNYIKTDDEPIIIPVKDKPARVQKNGRAEIDMTKQGKAGKPVKPTPKPVQVSPQPASKLHERFEVKSDELKNSLQQPAIRNFFTVKLGDPEAVKFFKQGKFIDAGNSWKNELQKSGVLFCVLLEMDCMKESVINAYLKTEVKEDFFLLNRKLGARNCFLVMWGKFYSKQEAEDAVKMVPQYFWRQQNPPKVVSLSRYLVN